MPSERTIQFSGGEVTIRLDGDLLSMPRPKRDAILRFVDEVEDLFSALDGLETHSTIGEDARPVEPSEPKSFGCQDCERTFPTEHGRDVHRRRKHPLVKAPIIDAVDPRKVPCDQCDQRFASQRAMKAHVGQAHREDPKPSFPDPGPMGKRPFDAGAVRERAAGEV